MALALATAIGAALFYGEQRLNAAGPADGDLGFALVQANIAQARKWDPDARKAIESDHFEMTREAARGGAKLVIWSESAVPASLTADRAYADRLSALAEETGVWILTGSVAYETLQGRRVPYNSAFLIGPGRGIAGRYDKQRLVPFGEYVPLRNLLGSLESLVEEASDFRPGAAPAVFEAAGTRLGPLICYEAIFPHLARGNVRHGAEILVNITNDAWYTGTAMPRQHLGQSVLRAVETRRPLLRCANTGISAAVDSMGRIVSRLPSEERGILNGTVEPRADPSVYAVLGDVFALACGILTVLAYARACASPGYSQETVRRP